MINTQFLAEESELINSEQREPGCVFWFDADLVELTLINRQYGREKGNRLLRDMEKFISEIPEVSACRRIRSGQFVFDVIFPSPKTDREIAEFWDERAKAFLEEKKADYPKCNLRICCGICPMGSMSAAEACDNAALARKESRKTMGYLTVVYTKELLDGLNLRRKRELEISAALSEKRFTYYLQPMVDLKTGRIIGAEALAREIGKNGEIVPPDEFIPIMEETGDAIELDFVITELVCKGISKRLKEGKAVVCTSVNLTRLHTKDPQTSEKLHDIAERYNVPTEYLKFEITETIPTDEYAEAKKLLDELREYGYKILIDDYGSGYTGIKVWQELDFDVLKMDKKFLSDDEELKIRNTVLIPHTIDIANKMNIDVVCEGVERPDQCESLVNWGCYKAQGFYFSQPVPPEEFYRYYEQHGGYYPLDLDMK